MVEHKAELFMTKVAAKLVPQRPAGTKISKEAN